MKLKKRDYREKDVRGIIAEQSRMKLVPTTVTVRMTSDKRGKSLSLQAANVMIQIALEDVEDIVKVVEK